MKRGRTIRFVMLGLLFACLGMFIFDQDYYTGPMLFVTYQGFANVIIPMIFSLFLNPLYNGR